MRRKVSVLIMYVDLYFCCYFSFFNSAFIHLPYALANYPLARLCMYVCAFLYIFVDICIDFLIYSATWLLTGVNRGDNSYSRKSRNQPTYFAVYNVLILFYKFFLYA